MFSITEASLGLLRGGDRACGWQRGRRRVGGQRRMHLIMGQRLAADLTQGAQVGWPEHGCTTNRCVDREAYKRMVPLTKMERLR